MVPSLSDLIVPLTVPVRPSCASHCVTEMEGGWQSLGALSFLLPLPHPVALSHASPHCHITLFHSRQCGMARAQPCSREKSLRGEQTTPLVSCSNLGMLSNVIVPSQPKDPPALVPGFGESPAVQQGIVTPWDRQPSPSAQHRSYLEHGASRAQGRAAPLPLPSGLLHLPHTALQHPLQTRDASSFGDWFAGTD